MPLWKKNAVKYCKQEISKTILGIILNLNVLIGGDEWMAWLTFENKNPKLFSQKLFYYYIET